VFEKKKVGNKPQKVEVPTPLFSWGEILEALGSFPYRTPLKRIKEIRKARETLENALKYLSGEAHLEVKKHIDELYVAEREAEKKLREYVLNALADIVVEKLMEKEG